MLDENKINKLIEGCKKADQERLNKHLSHKTLEAAKNIINPQRDKTN